MTAMGRMADDSDLAWIYENIPDAYKEFGRDMKGLYDDPWKGAKAFAKKQLRIPDDPYKVAFVLPIYAYGYRQMQRHGHFPPFAPNTELYGRIAADALSFT